MEGKLQGLGLEVFHCAFGLQQGISIHGIAHDVFNVKLCILLLEAGEVSWLHDFIFSLEVLFRVLHTVNFLLTSLCAKTEILSYTHFQKIEKAKGIQLQSKSRIIIAQLRRRREKKGLHKPGLAACMNAS